MENRDFSFLLFPLFCFSLVQCCEHALRSWSSGVLSGLSPTLNVPLCSAPLCLLNRLLPPPPPPSLLSLPPFPRLRLFLETCKNHLCRSASRTISPPCSSLQLPRVRSETRATAPHNAAAICSFISLEHPGLVRALEFINIHTTFIYGNIAHGVGVLVSETG